MTKLFQGLYTALITPFTEKNEIDYRALEQLIDEQINAQVDGIVILGTTGESPTIGMQERIAFTEFVTTQVNHKIKVILGTGSYNTDKAIRRSRQAERFNIDGLLVVNPFFNKPSQEGLYQHFHAIADAVDLPIMLYNTQGRTGVNLNTDTLLKLAEHKNIVAMKEASGNINQIMEVIKKTPDDFSVLCGDDALTYPVMTLGGDGTVSVLSNLLPKDLRKLVDLIIRSQFPEALSLHYKLLPLMQGVLSIGSNPMAIKTALYWDNKIQEIFRLPLCPLNEQGKRTLQEVLDGI